MSRERNVGVGVGVLLLGFAAWLVWDRRWPSATPDTKAASASAAPASSRGRTGSRASAQRKAASPGGAGDRSPVRDRQRADALREMLVAQLAAALEAHGIAEEDNGSPTYPNMPPTEGDGNQADKAQGEYVKRVMREQFVPLAGSCYEALLEREPFAAGDVTLDFSIMGDPSVGGVVVDVEFGEETTLKDPDFGTCVRESMYAVVFDAPPPGSPVVTVKQTFELAP